MAHNANEYDSYLHKFTSYMKKGAVEFFGLSEDQELLKQKWSDRCCLLHSNNAFAGSLNENQVRPTSFHGAISNDTEMSSISGVYRRDFTDEDQRDVRPPRDHLYRREKDPVSKMVLHSLISSTTKEQPGMTPIRKSFVRSISSWNLHHGLKSLHVKTLEDKFFDKPIPTSNLGRPYRQIIPVDPVSQLPDRRLTQAERHRRGDDRPSDETDSAQFSLKFDQNKMQKKNWCTPNGLILHRTSNPIFSSRPPFPGYKMDVLHSNTLGALPPDNSLEALAPEDTTDGIRSKLKTIGDNIMKEVENNLAREPGVGILGRCLGYDLTLSRVEKEDQTEVEKKIHAISADSHRPFMTYWVTFVQIVCFIVGVSVYGIASIGVQETTITDEIFTSRMTYESSSYIEADNMWIGPSQAHLVHLGAKFSPCMRKDLNVERAIAMDRSRENTTACCVLNDGSYCLQTTEDMCSETLATWLKWNGTNNPDGRFSGSVCGQDPSFCTNPASVALFAWPDEIISWPICTKTSTSMEKLSNTSHMSCQSSGRPCCIGIQGQCIMTTRENCAFQRGTFHEEANLCSQVSCMQDVCAMTDFLYPNQPDQFYRLWTSLFIHAGIIQLVISVVFQFFLMRDLEKIMGWLRICIIYVFCGIAGSLASAIFIPYYVQAGPSASQLGLWACYFVDMHHNWLLIENRAWALAKLITITVLLFVLGLLPMIDNYADIFGFILGLILSFPLMPHVTINRFAGNMLRKVIAIAACFFICVALFIILIILFYVYPVYSCNGCQYFNCVPFTADFCKNMEIKIVRYYDF